VARKSATAVKKKKTPKKRAAPANGGARKPPAKRAPRVPRRASTKAVQASADAALAALRAKKFPETSWDEFERAVDALADGVPHLALLPRPKVLDGLLDAFDLKAGEEGFLQLLRHLGLLKDDDPDPRGPGHARALWSAVQVYWLKTPRPPSPP
jgi:hypothetical protein